MLLFGGIFNMMIFGIPVWLWLSLLGIIAIVLSNVMWYFLMWKPLEPLHGLWHAYWNKTNAALVSNIDNDFRLVSEWRGKIIFDESVKEAKESERGWEDTTAAQLGTIHTDIIIDLNKWTDPKSEDRQKIEQVVDMWNQSNPDDQIHSFIKFNNYIQDGKIVTNIEKTRLIPWIRIEASFPTKRSPGLWAGYVRKLGKLLDAKEESKFTNISIAIIVASVVISLAMILYKFVR